MRIVSASMCGSSASYGYGRFGNSKAMLSSFGELSVPV